jgi:hypothetical protein
VGSFESLSREQLAALVPELFLCGQLIDRAGMPMVIGAFGREDMARVAIEEWLAASPVYTRRMQRALGFEGDDVVTIFKGIQLDVGAPPQFLDFRYRVHDANHGEFWLDHCGALADVEPMGDDYVTTMCHDIEDPTFDGTAIATNPRAQVRPVHRPPRTPADRRPVCHWTVNIEDHHPEVTPSVDAVENQSAVAAVVALSEIDPNDEGRSDYRGPLLDDLRFPDWSRSALVRIAEEACLQGHFLALSFGKVVARLIAERAAEAAAQGNSFPHTAAAMQIAQGAGVAGIAAERLAAALLGDGGAPEGTRVLERAAAVLAIHPFLTPHQYTGVELRLTDRLILRIDRESGAVSDGSWLERVVEGDTTMLDAAVWGVDRRLSVERIAVDPSSDGAARFMEFEIVMGDAEHPEPAAVAVTRFSSGATFQFEDRGTPVAISSGG